MENYLHPDSIFAVMGIKVSFSDFDDVPVLVAQAKYSNWATLSPEEQKRKESHIKKMLNSSVAERMTPALLTSQDPNNEIRSWLSEIACYL